MGVNILMTSVSSNTEFLDLLAFRSLSVILGGYCGVTQSQTGSEKNSDNLVYIFTNYIQSNNSNNNNNNNTILLLLLLNQGLPRVLNTKLTRVLTEDLSLRRKAKLFCYVWY